MNIKWNWGTKLLIAIILFMALIIGFGIASFQNDVNLVEKDYYPKGQVYQTRLNSINNAVSQRENFKVIQHENAVTLKLPSIKADTASIYFFRPSNTELDRIFDISKGDTIYHFDKKAFSHGKYILKVYWKISETSYYFERDFFYK
jgi:hypothetical protein